MERRLVELNAATQVTDDVSMNGSSHGRRTPEMGMVALSATDPITTMMGDREGPNQEEPNRRFYINAPHVHWHYHAAPQMTSTHDGEARRAIDRLADEAFRFGRLSETTQMEFREGMRIYERDLLRLSYRMRECEYGVQQHQQDLVELEKNVTKFVSEPARTFEQLTNQRLNDLGKSIEDSDAWYRQFCTQFRNELNETAKRTMLQIADIEQRLSETQQQANVLAQQVTVSRQEAAVIVEEQKRENQRLDEGMNDIEKRIAKYSDRFEKLEKAVCNEQVEKLEQELREYITGEGEMEDQITQAVNELKESLKRYVDERMEGMSKSLSETKETLEAHLTAIQSEGDSLKQILKQIQESLCEEEEPMIPDSNPLLSRSSEFTKPPGLTESFGEEICPQSSGGNEKEKFHPFLEFGRTADSVHSFPVDLEQLNKSDSEQSVIIEKRTLSPRKVEGFVPRFHQRESTMKFKAPRNYNPAIREPTIRTWLEKVDMYLDLSNCPNEQRIGATAMLLEGAAMTWYNGVKQQVRTNSRTDWANYDEFRRELLHAFEPMSEVERARNAVRNLRQMGRVTGYIQKFRDLRFQIPDMSNPEAFSHFVARLNPEIRTQIGIHVDRNDLEGAIALAERMDCYQQVEIKKSGQKGKFERKEDKKNPSKFGQEKQGPQLHAIQGETSSSGAGGEKQKGKKKQGKFRKQRDRRCMACHEESHWIQDCPYMARLLKTVRDEKKTSKN